MGIVGIIAEESTHTTLTAGNIIVHIEESESDISRIGYRSRTVAIQHTYCVLGSIKCGKIIVCRHTVSAHLIANSGTELGPVPGCRVIGFTVDRCGLCSI